MQTIEGGCLCGEVRYRLSAPPEPPVLRGFCAACGTPLTWKHQDAAGWIDIATGSLDDPEAFAPTHHAWLSDGVSWARFDDQLPKYRRSRKEEESTG